MLTSFQLASWRVANPETGCWVGHLRRCQVVPGRQAWAGSRLQQPPAKKKKKKKKLSKSQNDCFWHWLTQPAGLGAGIPEAGSVATEGGAQARWDRNLPWWDRSLSPLLWGRHRWWETLRWQIPGRGQEAACSQPQTGGSGTMVVRVC